MERFGYWNKILHVDLTAGTTSIEEPGDRFYRMYGGGRGFIGHYLLKHVPQGADPLGPNNVLVFAPGVLTGSPVPGAGRHSVGAKSPLSGGFGEAEAGGFWGAELKRAGWDAIVVHGASPQPVYLWVNEGTVEIRDAKHLWGKVTGDVEAAIREELGDERIRVAQIGPAGENLVRFANIGNDLNEFAGRSGMGAVMGSKKLRAIAVRGKTPVKLADQPSLLAISKWVSGTMDQVHRAFHEYGTGGAMQGKSLEGGIPAMNYREGSFDGTDKVDAIAIADEVRIEMGACYACSVRCKKVVQIEMRDEDAGVTRKGVKIAVDPKHRYRVDPKYGGPEYESLAALGTNLGVDDIVALCKSNEICNYLGMDTISAGSTIAWAMEAYEKGVLTPEDTDGVKLEFRDGDAVVKMLQMIAAREGIGDLLAEGSQRAAEKIGDGSEGYLTTVKGMEMAMHDPRHMPMMRGSYLLAPTGGDHMRQTGDKNGLRNQVGMCHFLAYDDDQTAQIINGVTGWGVDRDEMVATAHRGLTLARLFNMREGFTRADDRLPKRFHEDLPKHKGLTDEELEKIVTDYYVEQGWDPETGAPTRETVSALGLEADAVGLV
ncbi:MAG: aldehyde ferredoxin oxidoreductase [Anaerolinea sp.]|nr:aldehyde ferredoxin oxidoreductase [Anaerolinea sp.]